MKVDNVETEVYKLIWEFGSSPFRYEAEYRNGLSNVYDIAGNIKVSDNKSFEFGKKLYMDKICMNLSRCLKYIFKDDFHLFLKTMADSGFLGFVSNCHSITDSQINPHNSKLIVLRDWITNLYEKKYLDIGKIDTKGDLIIFTYNAKDPQIHMGAIAKLWLLILLN